MKKKKTKKKTYLCPYCGRQAVLRDARYVYGFKAVVRYVYVCAGYPECNAYVNVHEWNMEPMGTLANGELRNKRIQTHKVFDRIWQNGIMTKGNAYEWMKIKLDLSRDQAHIANFNESMCDRFIAECTKTLQIKNVI